MKCNTCTHYKWRENENSMCDPYTGHCTRNKKPDTCKSYYSNTQAKKDTKVIKTIIISFTIGLIIIWLIR